MLAPRLLYVTLPLFTVAVFVSRVQAEIPNRSPAELVEAASQIVVGKVGRIYSSVERSADYEFTYYAAEVVTSSVEKGDAIEAGDRILLRYWRKKYVGNGRGEPGHYGHRDAPQTGDRIRVYLTGDRHAGFDVVSPNGFAAPPAADPNAPPAPPTGTPE